MIAPGDPLSDLDKAGIPPRFQHARIADLTDNLKDYAENRAADRIAGGHGLWLFGVYGCGKTHALAALASHLLRGGLRVQWADWFWLFRALRCHTDYGATAATAQKIARGAQVLFLDDFGKPGEPQREATLLFEILNHRYNYRLATFFSCNTSPDQLFGPVGKVARPDPFGAIWDRFGECVESVIVPGTSRRRVA